MEDSWYIIGRAYCLVVDNYIVHAVRRSKGVWYAEDTSWMAKPGLEQFANVSVENVIFMGAD